MTAFLATPNTLSAALRFLALPNTFKASSTLEPFCRAFNPFSVLLKANGVANPALAISVKIAPATKDIPDKTSFAQKLAVKAFSIKL